MLIRRIVVESGRQSSELVLVIGEERIVGLGLEPLRPLLLLPTRRRKHDELGSDPLNAG